MYSSLFKKKLASAGRVDAQIKGRRIRTPGKMASVDVSIKGKDLHAPLIERLFDMPVDINNGTVNGEVRLRFHDKRTWTNHPDLTGRVNCKDGFFHIWDAPDDFENVNMDLVFEENRIYFHNATGRYGAIPVSAVGDMSLDQDGDIRVIAHSPGVEVNALRETLAARPLPYTAAGKLSGTVHVTGKTDTPVFTGTVVAAETSQDEVAHLGPQTSALEAMREAGSAGAYDRVPFKSASSVFTFDTKTQKLHLHHFAAETMGDGNISGSGHIWCEYGKEEHPQAVDVRFEGSNLPADTILRKYAPSGVQIPPALVLGPTTLEGSIKGAHLCPKIDIAWNSPEAAANGKVAIKRESGYVELHAPSADIGATVHTKYQPRERILAAITQEEVTAISRPVVKGAKLDCKLRGFDIMPFFSDSYEAERITSSQPIRLKLSGNTNFHCELLRDKKAKSAESGDKSNSHQNLVGEVAMEGLTLNHLNVARQMTGQITFDNKSLKVKARGLRPDEGLDVDIKLPDSAQEHSDEPAVAITSSETESVLVEVTETVKLLGEEVPSKVQQEPKPEPESVGKVESLPSPKPLNTKKNEHGKFQSIFSLRNRDVRVDARVNSKGTMVDLRNLRLDELELGSLRGTVDKGLVDLDFDAQSGRGNVLITGPRFSGLQGESLSGSFRWEGDIIRLERATVQQKRSKYELQGEYVLPTQQENSATDLATAWSQVRKSNLSSTMSTRGGGRWRWHIAVPHAAIEEMLPAAQLLSRATSNYTIDYTNAKGIFLEGVKALKMTAQQISKQLEQAAKSGNMSNDTGVSQGPSEGVANKSTKDTSQAKSPRAKGIPWLGGKVYQATSTTGQGLGLQDLRGNWKGNIQAYGSTGGAIVSEFDVQGEDWQWGSYCMENLNAIGNYHPNEGLHFEKVQLDAGNASLRIVGAMLGDKQDAQLTLTDFPLSLLQSVMNLFPYSSQKVQSSGTGSPGGLLNPMSHVGGLSGIGSSQPQNDDIVSGNLYVNAALGGSATTPQGNINFQVLDGSLRNAKLSRAEANAAVTSDQRFTFNINLQPASGPGHVKLMGSTPFKYSFRKNAAIQGKKQGTGSEGSDHIEIDAAVKDNGMLLVSSLWPQVIWQSGSADIAMQVRGTSAEPSISGVAHVNRASVSSPWLTRRLSGLGATVRLQNNMLHVDAFDGKIGRKGFIKINGFLPLEDKYATLELADQGDKANNSSSSKTGARKDEKRKAGIQIDAGGLELKIKNAFTGNYDGQICLRGSLKQPELSGKSLFSRGIVYLVPQGSSTAGDEAERDAMSTATVLKVLGVRPGNPSIGEGASAVQSSSVMDKARFKNFHIKLGPELRAIYPFVLNFGIAGEVELNGLMDQEHIVPLGVLRFDSGDVNLVATQLSLNPEYSNRAVFLPEQGLDPNLDISLVAPDLRALIQGRASSWQDSLVLSVGTSTGETTERLEPSEVARIFEGQLTESLLEQDGRLAFSSLAASTISTLLPRIETQGQFGKARWRLVSAPSISGLLSLDPLSDPFKSLSNLSLGTEVEIQFGKSLQAMIARKLKESEMATHWTLLYQLNKKLRMRLNNSSSSGTRLLFEYSGEGSSKLHKEGWDQRFP